MKNFVYFLSILLASTAAFAGKPEGGEEGKQQPSRYQRSISASNLRQSSSQQSSSNHIELVDAIIRPTGTPPTLSRSRVRAQANDAPQDEEKRKEASHHVEPPSIQSLINLRLPWGFDLHGMARRQIIVRENQKGLGVVDKEIATSFVNLGTMIQRESWLVNLPIDKLRNIAALAQENKSAEDRIWEIKGPPGEEKELNSSEKKMINRLSRLITKNRKALTKIFNGDLKVGLSVDMAAANVLGFVTNMDRVLRDLQELDRCRFGIIDKHLLKIPPRNEWESVRTSSSNEEEGSSDHVLQKRTRSFSIGDSKDIVHH